MAAPDSADRRTVVAQFETALTRARSDDDAPGTLVLTAGPGTGKTHTLRALMPRLGSTVRFAGADELSWRQPFAVAVDLLGVDLPQPIPDGFADDLYARVDALCASGPVALIVDDAHHADAASLDLVFRLAGATRHLPLTLILGRRRFARAGVADPPAPAARGVRMVTATDVRRRTRARRARIPRRRTRSRIAVSAADVGWQPDARHLDAAFTPPVRAVARRIRNGHRRTRSRDRHVVGHHRDQRGPSGAARRRRAGAHAETSGGADRQP